MALEESKVFPWSVVLLWAVIKRSPPIVAELLLKVEFNIRTGKVVFSISFNFKIIRKLTICRILTAPDTARLLVKEQLTMSILVYLLWSIVIKIKKLTKIPV